MANYVATRTSDPSFYGSVINWNSSNNNGWLLKLKNGTIYGFPANGTTPAASALVSISDRYGNQLTITRDPTYNDITQITTTLRKSPTRTTERPSLLMTRPAICRA